LHKIQTLPSIVKREKRGRELNVYMCEKKERFSQEPLAVKAAPVVREEVIFLKENKMSISTVRKGKLQFPLAHRGNVNLKNESFYKFTIII
jgi:hypothetical protein